MSECKVPPEGWQCSRGEGHEGPCAASQSVDYLMNIRQIRIGSFPNRHVETWFMLNGKYMPGRLYTIDNPDTAGYMPSRVWWDEAAGSLAMSFYTNPTMPDKVRPFLGGPTYVLVLVSSDEGVVQYPIDWPIFVDHVPVGDKVWYVVMFNHKMYDTIISE